jgi:tetratricopeptide (TPR) repeat protein
MGKGIYAVSIVLGLTVCVLAGIIIFGQNQAEPVPPDQEGLGPIEQELRGQIQQAEEQRDKARQRLQTLQASVSALQDQRNADQQVIQELWGMLTASARAVLKRTNVQADAEPNAPVSDANETEPEAPDDPPVYSAEAVKEMLNASGGNLDAALKQIITAEGIDRMLQEHRDQPIYWTAAASLAPDAETALGYLEEAARLHPESPEVLTALVQAQMALDIVDESTLAYISELEKLDPTNALGDCFAARCQFENGDIQGALQSLSEASAKGRFADDRIEALMSRYDYLLNEGVTDAAALGLSAFTLPLEHLGMMRQIEKQSLEQARVLAGAGQYDEALKIALDMANIGSSVSSSGRFLIHDRVGIAMQEAGLVEQRKIYEALADAPQVQEVDEKLYALQERAAMIDVMGEAFGGVMATMTEDDLAAYVDGTILNGEFNTLQNMPEIDEALKQAQAAQQNAASEAQANPDQ